MTSEETPVEGDAGASLLLNQPVVIDAGTASLKAGFAGSSKPKVRRIPRPYRLEDGSVLIIVLCFY